MTDLSALRPWLDETLAGYPETIIYGFADIGPLLPERLAEYPRVISFAVRMPEELMDSVKNGPTAPYFAEYTRVNALINAISRRMAAKLEREGFKAHAVHSSERTDPVGIRGEFPHKTGAVHAGLGWIGRNCQLITRAFGPRVRLGTVLTDMPLNEPSAATTRSYCGDCGACVTACPTGALTGARWTPGMDRAAILDAWACDAWKKRHYAKFEANVCGICTSACPIGTVRNKEKRRGASNSRRA